MSKAKRHPPELDGCRFVILTVGYWAGVAAIAEGPFIRRLIRSPVD